MKKQTRPLSPQERKIVDYMKKHGGITQMDAAFHFHCFRLSARIFDLRQAGYNVKTKMVVKKNKEGYTVNYARYMLA